MKAWADSCGDLCEVIVAGFISLAPACDFRVRDLRQGATSTERASSDGKPSSRLLALRGIRRRSGNLSLGQQLMRNSSVTILWDLGVAERAWDRFFAGIMAPEESHAELAV